MVLAGEGDLDAAAAPVCRFLALDVDGRGWPEAVRRDPVIARRAGAAARAAALDAGQTIERMQQVKGLGRSLPSTLSDQALNHCASSGPGRNLRYYG